MGATSCPPAATGSGTDMHPSTGLSGALARITIGAHRQIRSRDKQSMYYELAEREHQFQFAIAGNVGLVPVEANVDIKFDIKFLYEYGYLRDSQLLEPMTRFGFTSMVAPAGTIPYAHVTTWSQDMDLDYIGANVVVGVHNPAISAAGAATVTQTAFKFTLHCSFQGYGCPIDPDEPSDNASA